MGVQHSEKKDSLPYKWRGGGEGLDPPGRTRQPLMDGIGAPPSPAGTPIHGGVRAQPTQPSSVLLSIPLSPIPVQTTRSQSRAGAELPATAYWAGAPLRAIPPGLHDVFAALPRTAPSHGDLV